MQHVTSAQWLPPKGASESMIVAGVADGSLYVFKVRAVSTHTHTHMCTHARVRAQARGSSRSRLLRAMLPEKIE